MKANLRIIFDRQRLMAGWWIVILMSLFIVTPSQPAEYPAFPYIDSLYLYKRLPASVNKRSDAGCISPSGKLLGLYEDRVGDEFICIYEVGSGRLIKELHYLGMFGDFEKSIDEMAISPDDKMLCTISDKFITLWSLGDSNKELKKITEIQTIKPSPLEFSPDGRYLFAGGIIYAIESTAPFLYPVDIPITLVNPPGGYAHFSNDGSYLFISGGALSNTVNIWKILQNKFEQIGSFERKYEGEFAVDIYDSIIVEVRDMFTVIVWDLKSGQLIKEIRAQDTEHLVFSPDYKYLGIGAFGAKLISMESFKTLVSTNYNGWTVPFLGFSQDGALFASTSVEGLEVYVLPRIPPYLEINIAFDDTQTGADGQLNNGEQAYIKATISNTGKGSAYGVILHLSADNDLISFPQKTVYLGALPPSKVKSIFIPICGSADIKKDSSVDVEIETKETNGFDGRTAKIRLPLRRVELPKLEIGGRVNINDTPHQNVNVSEKKFNISGNGNGIINNGEVVEVKIAVTNIGLGDAFGVKLQIESDPLLKINTSALLLGEVKSGETKNGLFTLSIPRSFLAESLWVRIKAIDRRESVPTAEQLLKLPFHGFRPNFVISYTINDGDSPNSKGNGNHVIEQGEIIEFKTKIKNTGEIDAEKVSIDISTTKNGIVFTSNSTTIGNVSKYAESPEATFVFHVQRSAEPGEIPLKITITQNDFPPVQQIINLNLAEEKLEEPK